VQTGASESGAPARVVLAGSGHVITASRGVVVAVEGPEAARLLGPQLAAAPSKSDPGVGTCCLYFDAPKPPQEGNVLYLNGESDGGIVNNACFPSEVSRSYAPAGRTLASVSTIGTRSSQCMCYARLWSALGALTRMYGCTCIRVASGGTMHSACNC
jgi:hypothetical protein